ncbi:unnamed protein product [Cylindrotheca closterium]|uniref:RING-type domain-containing protein n=1 Tax=Cylindrotheca closterium TaxID=2856 RepID=A0AAD2FLP0_9STRA|nr:unnamed protein product [Cylindrotheca closterium]
MTDNTCSICLEPLISAEHGKSIGTAVPCGHCFHTKCFHRWKASRRTRIRVPCPNCNKTTDDFIKLFISCDIEDLQCLPIEEPQPKPRKSPAVVICPSPPRLASPSRITQGDPPSTPRPLVTARRISSDDTMNRAATAPSGRTPRRAAAELLGRNPGSTRSSSRLSPFRARVRDNNSQAPVISSRRHSTRSLGRMLQLSKMVKDLKVAQQSIVKQVHDHRNIIFTLGTCRQDQQTKRICKLRASQSKLTNDMEDHCAAMEDIPLDSLRRRDSRRIEEMQSELEVKKTTHREQSELVNTLYTTRLTQERARVARLREEQRKLNDTLRDYGAAIKALHHNRNTNTGGIRLRGRKQRHLTDRVGALGDAIQSINLNMLERDHVKKMKHAEDGLIALVQRVGDHGASIQSMCSVHHFLGTLLPDHEC